MSTQCVAEPGAEKLPQLSLCEAAHPLSNELPFLELVRAAALAPSPDNNQPWRFACRDGRILVFADDTRALPSDTEGMFCLLALGAAIENIRLAARALGYACQIKCLVVHAPLDAAAAAAPVAEITFQAADAERDPLFDQLGLRCTCRRSFERRTMAGDKLARLAAVAAEAGDVRVDWLLREEQLKILSRLVAAGDRIRFEHQPFHAELYRQLRFNSAAAEQTRDGLDLRTLELPPGGGLVLRLLRSWTLLSALNRLGFSRLLTQSAAQLVRRSGAIGAISVPECEGGGVVASYLAGGRGFQRLWLAAQGEGLALHPLGSLPIFMRPSAQRALQPRHRRRAEMISREFAALLPEARQRAMMILFRIGYAKPPDVRSLRRSPEELLASD